MKKLILFVSIFIFIGCNNDTQTNDGGDDYNSSHSVIGEWERTYYYNNTLFVIIFHENETLSATWGDTEIPTLTYSINDNIITFVADCYAENPLWPQDAQGNYSYTINNANTTLTLTVINDECTEYDDDREAFFSNESSAVWTRVN